MTFTQVVLAPWVLVACGLVSLAMLGLVLRLRPWQALLGDSGLQHRLMAATLCVALFWQLRAQAVDWLSLHLMFTALLTLIFKAPLALLVNVLVNIAMLAVGRTEWPLLGVNVLMSGVVPALVMVIVWRLVDRYLPDNVPIFIFVCGFLGSALSTLAGGLTMVGLAWVGASDLQVWYVTQEYALFLPLLMPSEAFITGMLLSLLVVYHPHWVATFNSHRYIDTK
ncbi:energy-coupling factor ABC transporter permease [Litchfieldella xinjiangensis]|uniref:energy-coupling factor ABC transporter permease n=1 Tax=Litchfieldella xinjiangensis TaxID=1166948 RepID=UPI0005BE8B46|nr:energy-coupling factor ABC transporter permease [Halomonas xinjiangensis]